MPQTSFQHEIRAALLNIARSKQVMAALKESVKMANKSMEHYLPFQVGNNVKLKGFVISRRISHSHQMVISVAPMVALNSLVATTLRKDNKQAISDGTATSPEQDQRVDDINPIGGSYNKYVLTLLSARYAWKNDATTNQQHIDNSYSVELFVNTRPTELAKLLKYVDVGTVVEVEGKIESISGGMTPIAALQGVGHPPLGNRWFESRVDVQYCKYKKYTFRRRNRADSNEIETDGTDHVESNIDEN
jgi:hypothetical protein